MDWFEIAKGAIAVGLEITNVILEARKAGKSHTESLQEARTVIDRKLRIDHDVEDVLAGKA